MARLSDEIKAQTHAALMKHNGNRRLAAAELGMSDAKFKDRIHACRELKTRWAKRRGDSLDFDPDVDVDVERRNMPVLLNAPQAVMNSEQLETQLAAAEARLATGLNILPITGEEKNVARSVHSFQIRHVTAASEIIHGCASLTAIKFTQRMTVMMARHDEVLAQLDDPSIPPEQKQALSMENETLLRTLPQFAKELRSLAEMVDKKQIAKEQLDLRKKEQQNVKQRGKPGFSPMVAVSVQPGGTVSISDKQ